MEKQHDLTQAEQQEAQGEQAGGELIRKVSVALARSPEITPDEARRVRAALATQPAAGEPVASGVNYADEVDLIRAVLEGYSPSIARSDAICSVKLLAAYFAAQPAAAHGDDAVRKDAEAAYVEMTCQPLLIDGAHHYHLSSERMKAFDRLFSVDVSNSAMRAQGDGVQV